VQRRNRTLAANNYCFQVSMKIRTNPERHLRAARRSRMSTPACKEPRTLQRVRNKAGDVSSLCQLHPGSRQEFRDVNVACCRCAMLSFIGDRDAVKQVRKATRPIACGLSNVFARHANCPPTDISLQSDVMVEHNWGSNPG